MNPPFSATPGVERIRHDADLRHLRSAFSMLPPGGRLAAITSSHCVPGDAAWRDAFAFLDGAVRIVFTMAIDGRAYGHHLGSSWLHSVRRRCRLRCAPHSALRRAPPAAPLSPLVRALLRSAPAAVLSTTPCSARGTPARSNAAAAPMSRARQRRFPER